MITIKTRERELGYRPRSLVTKIRRAVLAGELPDDTGFGFDDPWTLEMDAWLCRKTSEGPTPPPKEETPARAAPASPRRKRKAAPVATTPSAEPLHPLVNLKGYYLALGSMAVVNMVSYSYSAHELYHSSVAAGLFGFIGLGTALCMMLNFLSLPDGPEAVWWKVFAGVTIFMIDMCAMSGHVAVNAYLIPLAVAIAFTGGLAGAKKVGILLP